MITNGSDIYIRQSWLGDALMCLERGRQAIVKPEWRSNSDSTILGTATHSAIEAVLSGDATTAEMPDRLEHELGLLVAENEFKFTSMRTVEQMAEYGRAMCGSWIRDIMPEVTFGGHIEHKFTTPITEVLGHTIHITGTMDYAIPGEGMWDWKTANRKYSQVEKQKQNIQASVYALAAVKTGLVSDTPVSFKFGVMTRTAKSVGQIVEVQRTAAHLTWIETQIRNVVASAIRMGTEEPWPQVDQHFLCSEAWCSYWSICKGAHISEAENRWNPEEG